MAEQALAAVWRPGSGTQWVRWDMSDADFTAQDGTYFAEGLRVTSLAVRDGRIAAVWQPGAGTQWVHWGLSGDDFAGLDNRYFADGLRVTSLAVRDGRMAAVWQPGDGTQWVHWGLSGDDFAGHDNRYFADGLRVTSLAVDHGRIAAVWQPGTGTQWVHWGLTVDQFGELDRTYFGQGLRISSLALDDDRYAAVWQDGSGEQWWSAGRGGVDFGTEDTTYFGRGLRITSLQLQPDPVGAYRYPWKGGDTHNVGQGNNNAAGSHNGSQAWAFDFGLPAGTEVRAARSGTVDWVQDNLTATFDPSAAVSPTNTPFPDGSPQNWGNVVRLRHAGGFTSWYFHLQADTVQVAVGDEVWQGRTLALSGNTGRSTGAHLHFQVQADALDWGNSVPHTFGAGCEQPAGGTSVTSDNAG